MKKKIPLKLLVLFISCIAGIFIIDFFLPPNNIKEPVIERINYSQQGRLGQHSRTKYGIRTVHINVPVDETIYIASLLVDSVIVNQSKILKIVKEIEINTKTYKPISVYNFYCILPFTVLISGIFTLLGLIYGSDRAYKTLALNILSFLLLIIGFIINHYI